MTGAGGYSTGISTRNTLLQAVLDGHAIRAVVEHGRSWCAAHKNLPSGTGELSGSRCRGRRGTCLEPCRGVRCLARHSPCGEAGSLYSLATAGEFGMSAFGGLDP